MKDQEKSYCNPTCCLRSCGGFATLSVWSLVPSLFVVFLFVLPTHSSAEERWATIEVAKVQAWTGERVPILVELRTRGAFSGAASFDLPEVPGALLMKIGNPVIGSREIDGLTYFTQAHEFALFSQRTGQIKIPSFSVRFSQRDSFTGPMIDILADVPAVQLEIKRPPGTEGLSFVIASQALSVDENWSPKPGTLHIGDVIKRTVSQQAISVPGMALAPLSDNAPAGVRVYPTESNISDRTERGTFIGQRTDVVTYLIQKPGTHVMPALDYYWWNPLTGTLESVRLASVTFEVPATADESLSNTGSAARIAWLLPLILGAFVALIIWQRGWIIDCYRHFLAAIDSPQRVARRTLLKACRMNDAQTAHAAWYKLQHLDDLGCSEPSATSATAEVRSAIVELERTLYGTHDSMWNGSVLAGALSAYWSQQQKGHRDPSRWRLPPLNPQ